MVIMKLTLAAWLTRKYLAWQTEKEETKTVKEYAEYVGVSPGAMSNLMNGKRKKPAMDTVRLLAEKYGDEVYRVLDLPAPDQLYERLKKVFYQLSPDRRKRLLERAEKYAVEDDQEDSTDVVEAPG